MTIATDIDDAIRKALAVDRPDLAFERLRLRLGPGARRALVACASTLNGAVVVACGEPIEYRGITVEGVRGPVRDMEGGGYVESEDRFHGWSLRT